MEFLIIWFICGVIAAAIASAKGRNVVGWFFGGFFLGLIGIVIVACLSNKKEEEKYRQQVAQENRRLREKLDQERLRSEAFRQHVAGRLDSHDAQLGVDTRSLQAALPGPGQFEQPKFPLPDELESLFVNDTPPAAPAAASAPPAPNSKPSGRQWYFERNGESHGPVLEPELLGMFDDGRLDGATLVWTEALSEWVAAKRVKLLKPHIRS